MMFEIIMPSCKSPHLKPELKAHVAISHHPQLAHNFTYLLALHKYFFNRLSHFFYFFINNNILLPYIKNPQIKALNTNGFDPWIICFSSVVKIRAKDSCGPLLPYIFRYEYFRGTANCQ